MFQNERCARPRALEISEVDFATEPEKRNDWRLWKYTAFRRYENNVVWTNQHCKNMTGKFPLSGKTHVRYSTNKMQIWASGLREASRTPITECNDMTQLQYHINKHSWCSYV